jgi:hypothetical protein
VLLWFLGDLLETLNLRFPLVNQVELEADLEIHRCLQACIGRDFSTACHHHEYTSDRLDLLPEGKGERGPTRAIVSFEPECSRTGRHADWLLRLGSRQRVSDDRSKGYEPSKTLKA